MKFIIIVLLPFFVFINGADAQILDRVINRTKDKAKSRTEDKADQTVDKGLDKIEEGIGNIFKKKEDGKQQKEDKKNTSKKNSAGGNADNENTDFTQYKKFEFVPGKDILFFDDFNDRSTQRWSAYETGNINVVSAHNNAYLEVKASRFHPVGLKVLPKDFTLEFDAFTYSNIPCGTLGIEFVDKSQSDRLNDPYFDNSASLNISPITEIPKRGLASYEKKVNDNKVSPQNESAFYSWLPDLGRNTARVSMARSGNKLVAYINEEKIIDNPDFFNSSTDYMLTFHLQNYFVEETRMYLSNFRLAAGAPNAKTEMEKNGKFVTNAIYFDVNSARIKPQSWTTLKQVSEVIKAASGTIMIVGHTDSDGADEANIKLSQSRAASVKNALVNEFGIEATKLITDGKGEAQPVTSNNTASGKAQNRRVEFIKQ